MRTRSGHGSTSSSRGSTWSRSPRANTTTPPRRRSKLRDAENFRGSRCHCRDDPTEVEVSGPGATHQEGKGRGDARSTGGRFVESDLFFLERVRRVVARDGVDPAVAERVPQRFAVYGRSKRRIHFSLRPESPRSIEEEVQR